MSKEKSTAERLIEIGAAQRAEDIYREPMPSMHIANPPQPTTWRDIAYLVAIAVFVAIPGVFFVYYMIAG